MPSSEPIGEQARSPFVPPTGEEVASLVVGLLQTLDRPRALDAIAADPHMAGAAMMGLAYVAARPLIRLAAMVGGAVVMLASETKDGVGVDMDGPAQSGLLVTAAAANGDRDGVITLVVQILDSGKVHTRAVLGHLLLLADAVNLREHLAQQVPMNN